jgi:hypothetical protein
VENLLPSKFRYIRPKYLVMNSGIAKKKKKTEMENSDAR